MKEYREVIEDFNHKKIRYCILRNYEFLTDLKLPLEDDLDITIHEKDMKKADKILKKHGFTKGRSGYARYHIGYMKFLVPSFKKITFDIQVGGIYWNDIPYLTAEQLNQEKKKKDYFFIPSYKHTGIILICHSILGKRKFKPKYKKIIKQLLKKNSEPIEQELAKIFSDSVASDIIRSIKKNRFKRYEKNYMLLAKYIFKKPTYAIRFMKVLVKWLSDPKYNRLLRLFSGLPMITLMGPDGSGKSTNAEMLRKVLENNGRKTDIVYTGRGKSNLLPISKVGVAYKRVEKKKLKKSKTFKKILYTTVAPIYALDFILRYIFFIYPRRRTRIVITDRYASDMLLMKNVPLGFRKLLIRCFPKPEITFYLYNTPDKLYARKPEHPLDELHRQMKLYKILQDRYDASPIITEDLDKNFQEIATQTMRKLQRLRY